MNNTKSMVREQTEIRSKHMANYTAVVLSIILLSSLGHSVGLTTTLIEGSIAYSGINIEIFEDEATPREKHCDILNALEATLSSASEILHTALDGRIRFHDFNIFLPPTWDGKIICNSKTNLLNEKFNESSTRSVYDNKRKTSSIGGRNDIIVTLSKVHFAGQIETKQYGPCGSPGLSILIPFESLKPTHSDKAFVKEWAKYRYGVFDEIGSNEEIANPTCYHHSKNRQFVTGCADQQIELDQVNKNWAKDSQLDNMISPLSRTSLMFMPQSKNVAKFCDSSNHNRYAPTKQNYLCDRRSTLDVILEHSDFASEQLHQNSSPNLQSRLVNIAPIFNYHLRSLTRYAVILDNSLDSSVRESWGFLRSAFRKWVMYDLMDNTEIGLILASGRNTNKSLDIMPLGNSTNRELISSFLPYTPADIRQLLCVSCAIVKALEMIQKRCYINGPANHVILVVAPGMNKLTNTFDIKKKVEKCPCRPQIVTLNYPTVLQNNVPLDVLSDPDFGFSINEKKFNSEKSFLTSYVSLTNSLLHIGGLFHERIDDRHAPIELHRFEIKDSNEQAIHGKFYIENGFGMPSGFFIYTHSMESPLIQSIRLISPSRQIIKARSDQRMQVKQITLLTSLNETGVWHYEINRYPGNPQPHIVQVIATPHKFAPIKTKSWVIRKMDCFFLYTMISRSIEMMPIIGARATVMVTLTQNNTETQQQLELFDNGAGDIDHTARDGVYSRKLRIYFAGAYSFEFSTSGEGPYESFSRYSPIFTHYVKPYEKVSDSMVLMRILNFQCQTDAELILNCTWSMDVDAHINGYEIRYAFCLDDIIDNYGGAKLLTENHLSLTNADSLTYQMYQHDIKTTPSMYGEIVFFALKLRYKQIVLNAPVSNIVEVFINFPIVNTVSTWPPDANVDLYTTAMTTSAVGSEENTNTVTDIGQFKLALILSSMVAMFILLALLMYCYGRLFCHKRSNGKEPTATDVENLRKSKCEMDAYNTHASIGTEIETTAEDYSMLQVKLQDLHTIGIPVFAQPERHHTHQYKPSYSHHNEIGPNSSFYSGINIISSSTFDSSNEENWTAAQDSLPVVPPLPFPVLQRTLSQECPHEVSANLQSTSLYPPDGEHQYPLGFSDAVSTTNDIRKCRNVTMV